MNKKYVVISLFIILSIISFDGKADVVSDAFKSGAKKVQKTGEKVGDELSKAFNWEMNIKNDTSGEIYTAILIVNEMDQFMIGANSAMIAATLASLPVSPVAGVYGKILLGGVESSAAGLEATSIGTKAGSSVGGKVAIGTGVRVGTEASLGIAAREAAETATTIAAREAAEAATTTVAREAAETATTTAAREAAESAATSGTRAAVRETTESAAQKVGTGTAETAASKTAGLSKAERVLGQKISIEQQAELAMQQRYAKLFPKDSYKGGFPAWMEKNSKIFGDEIAKLGGTRPVTPAVKNDAMINLRRAWIAEDTTQSFEQWANPQRIAKAIEDVQAGKTFSAQVPGELAEASGQIAAKPLAEAPAAAPKTPTLQAAPKQPLPSSPKPIQVAATKTEPAPVLQETRALITSSPRKVVAESTDVVPEGKIVDEAVTVVKPTDIPAAPSSVPEIKPTTPQVNKPSATQLGEVKLRPVPKQEPKPLSTQDLLKQRLAAIRRANISEEEIDEPIEAITRITTTKTTPSASGVVEAPGTIPAPPPLPEAPVARAPIIRPRVEAPASPKPAQKTSSLEDILKNAFAKVPSAN